MVNTVTQLKPSEVQPQAANMSNLDPAKQKESPMWALLTKSAAQLRGLITEDTVVSAKINKGLYDTQQSASDFSTKCLEKMTKDSNDSNNELSRITNSAAWNTALTVLGIATVCLGGIGFYLEGAEALGMAAKAGQLATGIAFAGMEGTRSGSQVETGTYQAKIATEQGAVQKTAAETQTITTLMNYLLQKLSTSIKSKGSLDSLVNGDMSAWGQAMKGISNNVMQGLN